MDLPLFLLLLALSSAVGTLWRSTMVFPVRYNYGWITVSVALLVVAGIAWIVVPGQAGYLTGGVWLVLFGIPLLLTRLVSQLMTRRQFEAARTLSQIARLFHPFDAWWQQPAYIRAMQLEYEGQIDGAIALYRHLMETTPILHDSLTVRVYQLQGAWQQLIDDFEHRLDEPRIQSNNNILILYVRALGEVGRVDEMTAALAKFQSQLQRSPAWWQMALMFALAFSGKSDEMERLFADQLGYLPEEARVYWRAVAAQNAGNDETAQALFAQLLDADDRLLRLRVRERMASERIAPVLSIESQEMLDRQFVNVNSDSRYRLDARRNSSGAIMTALLILANSLVFLIEIERGGSENIRTLYDMGALWADAVIEGEQWWRLVNAIFLHYGWLHIILNMLALWVIGGFVEKALGRIRFLLVYFASGVGASIAIVLLTELDVITQSVTVGASGAIMGLFGASAGILLVGWRVERVTVARQYLTRVAMIILIQAVIDFLVPQTSFTGHAAGALIGFVVSLPLFLWMTRGQLVKVG